MKLVVRKKYLWGSSLDRPENGVYRLCLDRSSHLQNFMLRWNGESYSKCANV